jgi:hypothetical protein
VRRPCPRIKRLGARAGGSDARRRTARDAPHVQTLGIDLATREGSTGVCIVDWSTRTSRVEVGSGHPDAELAKRINHVRRSGGWAAIDAPFGFPQAFNQAVQQWANRLERLEYQDDGEIRRRLTDRYVQKRQAEIKSAGPQHNRKGWNTWPLSSVVDLITPSVLRCAQVLTLLDPQSSVDRIGLTSHVVEAYPISALRAWGIDAGDYKKNAQDCDDLMTCLCDAVSIAEPDGYRSVGLKVRDDAVDALVCAILAACVSAADGRTAPQRVLAGETDLLQAEPPLDLDLAVIEEEGWIHLPPKDHDLASLRDFSP